MSRVFFDASREKRETRRVPLSLARHEERVLFPFESGPFFFKPKGWKCICWSRCVFCEKSVRFCVSGETFARRLEGRRLLGFAARGLRERAVRARGQRDQRPMTVYRSKEFPRIEF